jgi:antitoxin component of MazEF toxin-antitoxin module
MIQQRLRKVGNSFVVTIPKDEIDRLHIVEGQMISLDITPMEMRPVLNPELKAALMEHWDEDVEAYNYLADR